MRCVVCVARGAVLNHLLTQTRPAYHSETSSAVSDRGVYVTDEGNATVSSYDVNYPPWGASAEDAWCPIAAHEWMAGSFVWTGFDCACLLFLPLLA